LAPTTPARQGYTGAARRSPLADGVTEGPGGGRVRVLRDRHGTRRRGAAAPGCLRTPRLASWATRSPQL